MSSPISDLGLQIPVIAAPMAGGPTTPAMVVAAHRAGGMGFLAAGYKTPDAVEAELRTVHDVGIPFGINIFAPNPVPITAEHYTDYAVAMQREADRFGLSLPDSPIDSDDHFDAKIELLRAHPVPIVSFTFGIPGREVIRGLQRAGSAVVQTVTSRAEAEAAAAAGVDALAVQASVAGGHSGTLTPDNPAPARPLDELVADIASSVGLPVMAAGGLTTAADVAEVLRAGAEAAVVGTVLLLADESGASATHQAALEDPARTDTVMTRAFTGRPARALRNTFIDTYEASAPLGYPAIHFLTSPLRKAAAAAGEPDLVHLWAGTGYRHARRAPTERILASMVP